MKKIVANYGFVENLRHQDQALADAVKWHEANGNFRTDREREAYRAGFRQAWADQRGAIGLHGGVRLDEGR